MPRGKARYTGDGAGTMPRDFSDKLKATLRSYSPRAHDSDAFVEAILSEARWAVSELHWQQFEITRQEARAERADLLKTLHAAYEKLRSLSPGLDELLGVDADPLGLADAIGEFTRHVEAAGARIEKLPTTQAPAVKQHAVALEMTLRVLRVLKDHGVEISATRDSQLDYTSDAVQILKAIGDDIGLARGDTTWRDIILKVKRTAG